MVSREAEDPVRSLERIFDWAEAFKLEVVEVNGSHSGLGGASENHWGWGSGSKPTRRVGVGVGWTVALPSGQHYRALREVTVGVGEDFDSDELHRVRGAVSEIAEAEVVRELDALSNWVISEGAVVRHLTDTEFYSALLPDLDTAQYSVLILAPFLGNRLRQVVPSLVAASARGVAVTVLVRPQYAAKASALGHLDQLRAAGVAIVERTNRMHEKVVVVDRQVAYHGSLNPLSHKATTESVMRFACPPIAESLYVLYHPSVGQSFAERVSIEILSGRGRVEKREAWGDVPLWYAAT